VNITTPGAAQRRTDSVHTKVQADARAGSHSYFSMNWYPLMCCSSTGVDNCGKRQGEDRRAECNTPREVLLLCRQQQQISEPIAG